MGDDRFNFEVFSTKPDRPGGSAPAAEDATFEFERLEKSSGTPSTPPATARPVAQMQAPTPTAPTPTTAPGPRFISPRALAAIEAPTAPRPQLIAPAAAAATTAGWHEVKQPTKVEVVLPAWAPPVLDPEWVAAQKTPRRFSRMLVGAALILGGLLICGLLYVQLGARPAASHSGSTALLKTTPGAVPPPATATAPVAAAVVVAPAGAPTGQSAIAPPPVQVGPPSGGAQNHPPAVPTAAPTARPTAVPTPIPPPPPPLITETFVNATADQYSCSAGFDNPFDSGGKQSPYHCRHTFTTTHTGLITVVFAPIGTHSLFTAITASDWTKLLQYPRNASGNLTPITAPVTMSISEPPGTYGTGMLGIGLTSTETFSISITHY